ncbi:alpha/beta hydrolase [Acuticoccus sediminis]|uniref:Palmitoyl-protein thioesterase ABHD10, mitochondrial n=1 Tax=Acuticoccus sediminis TaxID=2184697 RepID=A0A8B2NR59_9HYPH|nr:alpha/beta hydrolase [Acuticoccus sediminis]RAH99483.1 alpha/beta hydrolase [Acuticoccus sediminis]
MMDKATRISMGADELAVEITEGDGPTFLWLSGFRSDMTGGKAVRLAEWGRATGRRVVRFDYRGHGASSGTFENYALSDWLADAQRVADEFCPGPTVAVGSSMGGWIALLLARIRRAAGNPLAGLVLLAPAADFTERLMWPALGDEQKETLLREGILHLPSEYGDPTPVTRRLFEDGRQHLLYTDAPIETGCPVHILQGVRDPDVPYRHALQLVDRLAHDDVVVTLIKDGDHRLSREEDLVRLIAAVEGMVG